MRRYRFTIDILPEEDGKGYYAIVPVLPGCFSQGRTIEEAQKNIRKSIQLHMRALRKSKEPVPIEPEHAYRTAIEVAA